MTKRSIRFIASCAAAVAAIAAGVAQAQVPSTTGGGEVRAFLARSGTQVYAAAYGGGLFVSNDTGQSFTRVNTLPSNMRYLTGIAGNTSYILVAGDEGLARSTNGGTSWTQTLFEPVTAVAVGNGASNTVLVAVKGVGILRSTDGGASFGAAENSAFDSTDMTTVVFHPSNASIAYAAASPDKSGARGGVWRSINGGANWTAYSGNLPNKYVQSLTVDTTGRVFAGTFNPSGNTGGAYSTTNGTWEESTGTFSGIVSLHTDANVAGKVWAGSSGFGVYSGTSASMNYAWPVIAQPNKFFTGINAVATLPGAANVALKAIKGAGIWRTSNNGTSWTRLTGAAFPNADRVRSMAHIGGNTAGRLVGLHAGGVWRSTDSGGTYTEAFTVNNAQADFHFGADYTQGIPYATIWELAAHATGPNLVYAAAGGVGVFYRNDPPGLFRYNGSAWGVVANNAPAGAPANGQVEPGALALPTPQIFGVAMNPADSNQVYASFLSGSAFIVRRSGGTWINEVPGGLPQVRTVVPSANGAVLLALNFNDKPNRSVNNGDTWTPVSVSQSGFDFLRFFAAAENPGSASNWIAGTNKGIFRSDDAGASWSRVSMASPFQQLAITAVGFNSSGKAFAADMAGNRYCSPNGGFTWVSAGTALRAGVNAIRRINNELYYLTDGAGMQREDGTC